MASHNQNCKELRNSFRCSNCQKGFMMEHNRNNHQRLCEERSRAMEKNPSLYKPKV